MSTPASLAQGQKTLALFSNFTSEQVQKLLANGDLIKKMAAADLSKVDRAKFQACLAPQPKQIDWTPVAQYADKLRDWNSKFSLGLTTKQITDLAAQLPDHAGILLPTSISLTLGKGLQHDWEVVMQILAYELGKLGVSFEKYVNASRLSYFPGSKPAASKKPQLGVALLDIGRFWDPQNGIMPRQMREQLKGQRLPALEVAWLLALNPQVFASMDGEVIPFMWAPGLVVGSVSLPYFDRDSDGAFVLVRGHDDQWSGYSAVVFREC